MKGDHIGSVAQCLVWARMRFNEETVHAHGGGGSCQIKGKITLSPTPSLQTPPGGGGSCQIRGKLAVSPRASVKAAGALNAVRDVKNNRGKLAHNGKRAHIHH